MDQSNTGSENRPAVLDQISETQMDELDRHYDEQNRDGWNTLGQSYGWSEQQSEEVWNWFGEDPSRGARKQSGGGDASANS